MKKYIISLFLITQIFAFAGLGVYGASNHHSSTAPTTENGAIVLAPGPMNNSIGGGLFIYLDVIPVVDLEASFEVAAAQYPFTISIDGTNLTTYDFGWVRASGYYTVRKKIYGVGIPFLAKAQFYGGAGFNTHSMTPDITVDFIGNAFPEMALADAVSQDFSNQDGPGGTDINKQLMDYLNKYNRTTTGFHVQLGAQAKLLFVNLFINARYTIAKDVVYGTSGFSTIWTGLAIGL